MPGHTKKKQTKKKRMFRGGILGRGIGRSQNPAASISRSISTGRKKKKK